MAIVLDGTSGATLPVPLAVAQGGTGSTTLTLTSPVIAGTPTGVGVLTSGTAVASTSGTSIDFTSIPSWAKRITVMFNGVSTNGTSPVRIQIGSGSVETSGYIGGSIYISTSGGVGGTNIATLGAGFDIQDGADGTATTRQGANVLSLLGSNAWVMVSNVAIFNGSLIRCIATNGSKTTSGALDRVRITTINGTDVFDAGSINILYE